MPLARLLFGWLPLVLAVSGCAALQGPSTEISTPAPLAKPVVMVYRTTAAGGTNSDPTAADATHVLSLKYPHPKCKPGHARVELVRYRAAANAAGLPQRAARALERVMPGMRMGDGVDAAWMLEVPRKELDAALAQLGEQQFFSAATAEPAAEVMLAVETDGQMTARRWKRVTALDQLAAQARREGKLVSHTGEAFDLTALIDATSARMSAQMATAMTTVPVSTTVAAQPGPSPLERLPPVQR